MTKVAVIGIGQSLRGDDAVGLEAVRQWQEKFPEMASRPELRIETCELPGLTLLDLLTDVDHAILVDAINSSAQPGTIHHITSDKLMSFTTDSKSAHGWGVAETLQMGRQVLGLKTEISLIGIEAGCTDIGAALSPPVEAALPEACLKLEKEIQALLK